MLTIAIVGREFPEYVSLTDDTSNDGEITDSSQENVPTLCATKGLPFPPLENRDLPHASRAPVGARARPAR
jgi:hypothetical protein